MENIFDKLESCGEHLIFSSEAYDDKVICLDNELNFIHSNLEMDFHKISDSKVHGANMGATWVLEAPDGPHVGPMNLAISDYMLNP